METAGVERFRFFNVQVVSVTDETAPIEMAGDASLSASIVQLVKATADAPVKEKSVTADPKPVGSGVSVAERVTVTVVSVRVPEVEEKRMSVMRVVTSSRNVTRAMVVDVALTVKAGVSSSSTEVTDLVTTSFSAAGLRV